MLLQANSCNYIPVIAAFGGVILGYFIQRLESRGKVKLFVDPIVLKKINISSKRQEPHYIYRTEFGIHIYNSSFDYKPLRNCQIFIKEKNSKRAKVLLLNPGVGDEANRKSLNLEPRKITFLALVSANNEQNNIKSFNDAKFYFKYQIHNKTKYRRLNPSEGIIEKESKIDNYEYIKT